MEQVMKDDQYLEHDLHKKGTWTKTMKVCSECYKARQEFKANQVYKERLLDWRERTLEDLIISPNPLE